MLTTAESAPSLTSIRSQFPSLAQTVNGQLAVFFDGPGGTQVPQRVIDAISNYLRESNSNTGGAYATSRRTDAMIAEARAAMADFLHCAADEVIFGQNMTSLTYMISRSFGREVGGRDLQPGDEILVTRLDHDANVSPWLQMAEDRNLTVRWAEINETDCTLDMRDLASKITSKTKLVAVGYASNAVGTINPVKEIIALAHKVGALAYIDAVHYAPHGLIDVAALDCDFLVCSTYKFFGPHMGVLFGKREHLQRLRPYKVRPLADTIPFRWEHGTLNHEGIAGIAACVDYIADIARDETRRDSRPRTPALSEPEGRGESNGSGGREGTCGDSRPRLSGGPEVSGRGVIAKEEESGKTERRAAIEASYATIHEHELTLLTRALDGFRQIPGLKIYGITDPAHLNQRCATLAVRMLNENPAHTPAQLATKLGERGIFTWDGNYYALNLTEKLDVEKSGGFLRIGLVHYNTVEEVDRLLAALRDIVGA